MRARGVAALVAAAGLLTGCSFGTEDEGVPGGTNVADLRERARIVAGPLEASPSGLLAYVGTDGNVYVLDPASGETVKVTGDGSSAGTGGGIFHAGLAWSQSGRLAFARTDPDAFRSSLFVTVPGGGAPTRLTDRTGILIYASWSRPTCPHLPCSRLATITDADGEPGGDVKLDVLEFPTRSSARSTLVEEGGQIYLSWAGADRLIRHLLELDSRRLDDLDLAAPSTRAIEGRLAPFLAPAASGEKAVYALADAGGREPRVTLTDRAVIVHAPEDARRVAFAPSPDGRRLAFAVRSGPGETPDGAFDAVRVADLETGEVVPAGPTSLWTKAFYWSPDGSRLAYLSALDSHVGAFSQWRIFDVETGSERGLVAFEPTPAFETMATFFDQFGQSHSFWSPDGRYLAYAAADEEGAGVWLLDTRDGAGRRILVADGVAAVFSWR